MADRQHLYVAVHNPERAVARDSEGAYWLTIGPSSMSSVRLFFDSFEAMADWLTAALTSVTNARINAAEELRSMLHDQPEDAHLDDMGD
jgi:hypothetical protein